MSKFSQISREAVPEVDIANIPEQMAGRDPLPLPGKGYVLALPFIDLNQHDVDDIPSEKGPAYSRIVVPFGARGKQNENYPAGLRVVKSPTGEFEGNTFRVRISNEERKFDDAGGAQSAMFYLLMAFGEDMTGKSNYEYAEALARHSGESFKADIAWTANCSPKTDIYRKNWETGEGAVVEGVKGCGTAYASYKAKKKEELPKDENGRFVEQFDCACGATLGVFVDLRNYQPTDDRADEVKAKIEAARTARTAAIDAAAVQAPKQAAPQRPVAAASAPRPAAAPQAPSATKAATPAKR